MNALGTHRLRLSRTIFCFSLSAVVVFSSVPSLASQQTHIPKIGWLSALTSRNAGQQEIIRFLRDFGYIDGKNIKFEFRYAANKLDRLPALAEDLVNQKVDLLITPGTPSALALRAATKTIPIIFLDVTDPVASGLVDSLARPGGNITGMTALAQELGAKRLEIFRETFPTAGVIAILANPDTPDTRPSVVGVENAARSLGIKVRLLQARDPAEVSNAFATLKKDGVKALMVVQDAMFVAQQKQIVDLAAKTQIPAIYAVQDFVEVGGLMFYGVDLTDMYRRAASHVDKILKGAKPADLPIEQPTKFELVINLKTAKALGIKIPDSIMLRADKVIE